MGAGNQVFALEGSGHAYRLLIESMNEGAVMLSPDGLILYANRCFAQMTERPMERVVGSFFPALLSPSAQSALRPLLQRPNRVGAKIQVALKTDSGRALPVTLSIRPLARTSSREASIGLVVTDMTEARKNEENLRSVAHRVVQAQEAERFRVGTELHDNITQLLCAILFRSETLANELAEKPGATRTEARKLRQLIGQAARAVERVSRQLHSSVLDHLGLTAALHEAGAEFRQRTGIGVRFTLPTGMTRLPPDIELALYRIFQEALVNVEKHAAANVVAVQLASAAGFAHFLIKDNGTGFASHMRTSDESNNGGLGFVSMRERAAQVGGTLAIKSTPRRGTEIRVKVPLTNLGRD